MQKLVLLCICLFSICALQAQVEIIDKSKLKKAKTSTAIPHPVPGSGKLLNKDHYVSPGTTPAVRDKKLPASRDVKAPKNNGFPTIFSNDPVIRLPHQQTMGHQNCQHDQGVCDPRNLPLSENGKLLSVDGYEIDFRTSGNPDVVNTCATPRGYINDNSKNAACGFSVPCDNPSNRDAAANGIKYFQVVWHVMQSTTGGASSNINQTRIDDLMAELNADFATHNMIFCADPATFYVDDVNYTHDSNTEEVSLKTTYNVTPAQVINIYVVGSMTAGGYARFPYDPMGGTSVTGGIVLNRGNCNLGTHTLAHEMGHTFGLEHTFAGVDERGQCSNCYERVRNVNGSSNTSGVPTPLGGPYTTEGDQEGDWCSDTHPHDTYSYNCSTSGNANGGCDSNPWANAPVNNHMSYSFCSSQFTTQQSNRMHCMVNTYLGSWTSYGGGVCGAQPPVADFDGTPTTWMAPNIVNYNDLSSPTAIITSWTWTFDVGASGSVTCVGCVGANAQFVGQTPPAVTYPNPGLYTVSLTVTSANGNHTETKVDYIEVLAPAGDCDTLDLYWTTPVSSPTIYGGLAAGEHLLVVPDLSNSPGAGVKGAYERFITPNPGVTKVGAVRVGLGSLTDPDDDMVFQVVVYDDNGAGEPGALLGGVAGISPTQLGVPAGATFNEFWIPLNTALVPTTAQFHVGIEVFPGDPATDELVVVASSTALGEGQGNGLNHIFSTGFGYENLQAVYGLDVDLDLYPMLGEYTPLPLVFYSEDVQCDTSFVTLSSIVLYSDSVVSMSYSFSDGTVMNFDSVPSPITRAYTVAGPELVTVSAINECGRADTVTYSIPYNFMTTPDADFTKDLANPICIGDPVTFTANTANYQDYTWDYGDGTAPFSSGGTNSAVHTYTAAGLYYTSLDVTSLGYQPIDTFYLETFAAGYPAGYQRFNNDAFTPFINPPFDGTNATAWLALDADGDGDNEATSTSYNTGAGQQGDDWMITSGLGVLPANQMLSWDAEALDATFRDGYEVRISTVQLPATVGNYSTLLMTVPEENNAITTRSVNLSAYVGQTVFIAFRNNSTDEFLLTIDNIRIGTIGSGCSNTEQKLDFVEVVDCSVIPPTAVLGAAPTSGCIPLDVTFTDNTTVGDAATSWVWNFGDGTFSTVQNPGIHTYTAAGSYFVIFQACNAGGCTTDTITITTGDVTVAAAGPDQSVCGDVATLAANNPAPYSGVWSIVSGSGTFTTPTAFNTTVTNLGPGTNIFAWTITGTSGCSSSDNVRIAAKSHVYGLNGATTTNYCTDAAGWHHFFNAGNEILLSIRGDLTGAPAGFPSISIGDNGTYYQQTQGPFTPADCAANGLTPGEERFEMERNWNIDFGGGTLNPPYDVRFYYQPAERTAIENAAMTHMATYPSCSYTYKYANPLGLYWFKNTGSNYTAPDYDGTQLTGTPGAVSGINYTELTGITSFSGGSAGIIVVPDPLLKGELLFFDGVTDNKTNFLRWATESEQNSAHFNLQRSKDGVNFTNIAVLAAHGNSSTTQNYNFDDVHPFTGENYYRLEMVDLDGSVVFSKIVLLVVTDSDLGYVFYPNPTNDLVHYQYEAQQAEQLYIEVIDVLGRVLTTQQATSVVGINNIAIDLESYPVGSYMVRVTNKASGSVHASKVIRSNR